ncbi:MAG: hypothetical protein SH847_01625 [Roseiflexaceae bacterium]|nr:hypothetical protein [Roseiflexaceae bacterium]
MGESYEHTPSKLCAAGWIWFGNADSRLHSLNQPECDAPCWRGTITQVNQAITGDILGSLLVEGKLETDTHYDRASITITKQTVVLEQQGQNRRSITFADLQKGQLVQVGFIGAVAETYPVQAQADEVVILK